jgi:phosphatidate cytidylyltransferase
MLVRILTGLVGIPLFLGLLYVGKWPLFALVAGMGLIGFHEYTRMWKAKGVTVAQVPGYLAVLALLVWAYLTPGNGTWLGAILSAAVIATLTWVLFRFEQRTIVDAVTTIGGVVYVGFLLTHLLMLRGLGQGTGFDSPSRAGCGRSNSRTSNSTSALTSPGSSRRYCRRSSPLPILCSRLSISSQRPCR